MIVFFVLFLSENSTPMKISFKPIVISGNRRKDGTWAVAIRVTFKGISRRLPTALVCTASDLTRSGKIKSPAVLAAGERIVAQMRDAAAQISPFDLELMDVDAIVARIRSSLSAADFHLDFFEFADEFLKTKKPSTRHNYITALSALRRFIGRDTFDINEFSAAFMQDFHQFLKDEPKIIQGRETSHRKVCGPMYIYHLQHIFNAAKDRYNDEDVGVIVIPRSPFSKVRIARVAYKGQDALPDDLMQRIILARSENLQIDRALAVFVLSFLTMGANLADLWLAPAFKGKVWKYNRLKTAEHREDHAEMRVYLQSEMRPYLERLGVGAASEWWLPALHEFDFDKISFRVDYRLARWCELNDVPKFSFYAARHTFATLARQLKVEVATVDEALAHKGNFEMANIYAQRAWDVINAANRVTIDHFRWPSTDGATLPENIVNQR